MSDEALLSAIRDAAARGALSPAAAANVDALLRAPDLEAWERESVRELADAGDWAELDHRFYARLAFGTGGLRGRSIARTVTRAERGAGGPGGRPEHPAVGSTCMNARIVRAATRGLVSHLRATSGAAAPLTLVVGHDTRLFSPELARAAAEVASRAGVRVLLFAAPVSTPQLAFTLRRRGAQAGIMITASHNPPHDNGYKVYRVDGAQIVADEAESIAARMTDADDAPTGAPATEPGGIASLGAEADAEFHDALDALVLAPDVVRAHAGGITLVVTPLHGAGARVVPAALRRWGFDVRVVAEQATPDGNFPTVASPNPEDPRAYRMAIDAAAAAGAQAVLATDPDADRLGVAVRDAAGEYRLLTGNQLGAILADYRLARLAEQGVLTPATAAHVAVLSTVVTSRMIPAVARAYGVRCVETLTGFKHVGAKLRRYAAAATGGDGTAPLPRDVALARGTHVPFACEESYGYLAGDYVRDKDANGAALMTAEAIAHAAARGLTLLDVLDDLHVRLGCFVDRLETLTLEGPAGAAQIRRILAGLRAEPPSELAGVAVARAQDHAGETIVDADGEPLPKETMVRLHLADGSSVAVRGSGTEPKLKFYLSAQAPVPERGALAEVRARLQERAAALWDAVRADAMARAG